MDILSDVKINGSLIVSGSINSQTTYIPKKVEICATIPSGCTKFELENYGNSGIGSKSSFIPPISFAKYDSNSNGAVFKSVMFDLSLEWINNNYLLVASRCDTDEITITIKYFT